MTELEKTKRAYDYINKLAQGIDPLTDTTLQQDTALNNDRLSRCFQYVAEILQQVIRNGGAVGRRNQDKKLDFTLTEAMKSRLAFSEKPIPVSELVKRINETITDEQMKYLTLTPITTWLVEKGFLDEGTDAKNKRVKFTNGQSVTIGITSEVRTGQYGQYTVILYTKEAQQFVADNLNGMLEDHHREKERQKTLVD
ncbi:MAG: hypothetical protein BGN88_05435 [Clostridiales bacterium 43-6]|nr:MAG: hypothetical protein BGN88_05435 [Clostridiales bacterium 43-6]